MNILTGKSELEAAQQTIKFFETVLRVSIDGVVISDITQNIIVANEAFCDLFNCPRKEMVETSLFVWLEQFDPGALNRWTLMEKRLHDENFCRDVEFQMTQNGKTRCFNVNASLLERVAQEEAGVIVSIWSDVTKLKHAKEALQKAHDGLESKVEKRTEALRQVNDELAQYAFAVSHDLKAPLRAVKNYADFLNEDLAGTLDGDQQIYLEGLKCAVNEADTLVEALLNFSRMDQRDVYRETIDIGVFLRQLIKSLFLPSHIRIVVKDDWPAINVEGVLLRQIFQNLIDNGIKYNKSSKKQIELGWHALENGHNEFFVRDNGIGIHPMHHEQIFRIFNRLHVKEEYDGSGIGLAIVKKAVDKLGGSIRIESKPEEGSTFFIKL